MTATTICNKTKQIGSRIKEDIVALGLSTAAFVTGTVTVYSGDGGAFDAAQNATKSLQKYIVSLSKTLLPFALIVLIVSILFTHDQKALQMELKTALIVCVAYIALLIIDSGALMNTLENLGIG